MAAVTYQLSGATTHATAKVTAKTDTPGGSAEILYSTSPIMSDAASGGVLTVDAKGYVQATLVGLQANSTYYWQVKINGVTVARIGRFRTHPSEPGKAGNFTVAFSSCSGPASGSPPTTHPVFQAIKTLDPLIFQHMGDLHYQNIGTNNEDLFLDAYSSTFTATNQIDMYQHLAINYVWDDHDYGADDSNGSSASKTAVATAYRRAIPHYPVADAGPTAAIYHAYTVGRIRFLVTDQRYHRSSPSAGTRTMLGATQLAWFKAQIAESFDDPGIIMTVWVSSQVPYAPVLTTDANWSAYQAELFDIWDFLSAQNAANRFCVISGDIHAAAHLKGMDYSTAQDTPIDVFAASPLEQYSQGDFPYIEELQFVSKAQGAYASMTVLDNGLEAVITWKFWHRTGAVDYQDYEYKAMDTTVYPGDYALMQWDGSSWKRRYMNNYDAGTTTWKERRWMSAV